MQNDDLSNLAGRARRIPDALLERAREMRKLPTEAEALQWEFLRNRRLCGAKFRRQHNTGPFIADF